MTITIRMNRQALIAQIKAHQKAGNGRIFSVTYARKNATKCGQRKAGDIETFNGRFAVKKHLKGDKKPKFTDQDNMDRGLLGVYACSRKPTIKGIKANGGIGYRTINLDSIQSVTIDGVKYKVA